ncbi:MAG: 2-C-methyl-D-erythritol 4-phosphate cytidylyltransferase [Clostridiaceae bacterium]|nr:2-C-methyl-D-erythritol 4-phosphate cytidylyltransferase [Clostridiaceae bacterium]
MKIQDKVSAIIVAAGKGKRMGKGFNKQYILLKDKPILAYTINVFERSKYVDEIILVVGIDEIDYVEKEIIKKYDFQKEIKIVAGGKERQDSVYEGLKVVRDDCSMVLIHDGARPFLKEEIICRSIEGVKETGAVIVAVQVKDTIKVVNHQGEVVNTPERNGLWAVQTPQTFNCSLLKNAHEAVRKKGMVVTDDAMMVEALGHKVKVVEGSYDNIKITTPEDLIIGEIILEGQEEI